MNKAIEKPSFNLRKAQKKELQFEAPFIMGRNERTEIIFEV